GEAGAGRQLGREALDDGDPAGTQSDDGDGGGGGHGVLLERKFSEWRITKGSVRDVAHTGNVPEQLARPRSGGVGMYRPWPAFNTCAGISCRGWGGQRKRACRER